MHSFFLFSLSSLFCKLLNTTTKSLRVAHIEHSTIQTDTHHTTLLADSLQGSCQLNFLCGITSSISLCDIAGQLSKDFRCKDVLSKTL